MLLLKMKFGEILMNKSLIKMGVVLMYIIYIKNGALAFPANVWAFTSPSFFDGTCGIRTCWTCERSVRVRTGAKSQWSERHPNEFTDGWSRGCAGDRSSGWRIGVCPCLGGSRLFVTDKEIFLDESDDGLQRFGRCLRKCSKNRERWSCLSIEC